MQTSETLNSNESHNQQSNTATANSNNDPKKIILLISVLYISVAAILGSSLRVFLGRFFGGDCEDGTIVDFMTPVSSKICITSSGRTLQTGGALFRDLPANMIGSFIMGLISSRNSNQVGRFPSFHKDHPFQKDDIFHIMITTGFCGSLTTFASWNTQMVVMMDGTYCKLGSQVLIALCGYLFGLMLATSSFQCGLQVAACLYSWRYNSQSEIRSSNNDVEEIASDERVKETMCPCCSPAENSQSFWQPKLFMVVCFIIFVALFIVGDVVYKLQFYKNMIITSILAPFGALIRWKLAKWNDVGNRNLCTIHLSWVPVGTLLANLFGSVISVVCTAIVDRNKESFSDWTIAVFFALQVGLAGSLSTVSSMVKEIVFLSEDYPGKARGTIYASITCISASLVGLIIYAPIARIT